MGLKLLYNRGKGESEHLNKNIKMFEGFGIECSSFRIIPKELFFGKADILYLNWYENIYNGSIIIAVVQFIVKNLTLCISKIRGIRIFASQHNRVQHDSKHPKLSRAMFRNIYRFSEKIIIFSESSIAYLEDYISHEDAEKKAYYIPPVNYIGSYSYKEHEWITNIVDGENMIILFVGSLNHPYKNVDMVIDIADEMKEKNIKFVFAGKMSNQEQVDEYKRKIKGKKNIIGEFRFIKDEEMAQLLKIAHVVIMPYDVESISNSGTARLAFSYAKTIICPLIASLENIPKDLIYCYVYKDKEDHRNKVKCAIDAAYEDYITDENVLREKGIRLKQIMEKFNSPEVIEKKYKNLFLDFKDY